MKNRQTLFTVALTLFAIALFTSCGSSKKASSAAYTRTDELNEKLQQLEQAGWQVHGSTRTLRGKLSEHYAKIAGRPLSMRHVWRWPPGWGRT